MIRSNTPVDAARSFRDHCKTPLDEARLVALDALVASCGADAIASLNSFMRFRNTNLPPDGGRNSARTVFAAVTNTGIRWATIPKTAGRFRKTLGASETGIDRYEDFAQVTVGMAEVLLEVDASGSAGIGFTDDNSISREPGPYIAALEFVIAVAELGFGGAAGTTPPGPTPEEVTRVRSSLGLA